MFLDHSWNLPDFWESRTKRSKRLIHKWPHVGKLSLSKPFLYPHGLLYQRNAPKEFRLWMMVQIYNIFLNSTLFQKDFFSKLTKTTFMLVQQHVIIGTSILYLIGNEKRSFSPVGRKGQACLGQKKGEPFRILPLVCVLKNLIFTMIRRYPDRA